MVHLAVSPCEWGDEAALNGAGATGLGIAPDMTMPGVGMCVHSRSGNLVPTDRNLVAHVRDIEIEAFREFLFHSPRGISDDLQ
jgi:hypothetical protein